MWQSVLDRIRRRIGLMRSGSLTRQHKDSKHDARAHWQISYISRKNRGTVCGRRAWVTGLSRKFVTHKRFKRLVAKWIDLRIEHAD